MNLVNLCLRRNALTTLPLPFAQLRNLQVLELSYNGFAFLTLLRVESVDPLIPVSLLSPHQVYFDSSMPYAAFLADRASSFT